MFGEFIKRKRVGLGLTLRDFCNNNSYDPGNHSRLENGIQLPPNSPEKLEHLADALSIKVGSHEWDEFSTLAAVARKEIPQNIDARVLEYLPAFFRKASKKEITEEEADRLIALIKGESESE